jgi:hypothetical protein
MKLKFIDRDSLLIWLYIEILEIYQQSELPLFTVRFSNNYKPIFTDAELFTCAIFTEVFGHRSKKDGYNYIKSHYANWFPCLPCYEIYNRKLNKFSGAIRYIYKVLAQKYGTVNQRHAVIDTEPIEVCQPQHSLHAKAARPFVAKGYCAAKKKFYVGAKLQVVAQDRKNKLPFPFEFALASASFHDLEIAKATLPYSEFEHVNLYADLAYNDNQFQLDLFEEKGINVITPIKKKKGQQHLTLFEKATNSIHASVRQPIDTLFGWINDQTGIQNASKVRSVDGLFYHVSVKMLAALILMLIKF